MGLQGDYLARAFQYAQSNMPLNGPLFIFNLDTNALGGYTADCTPGDFFRWYSLLYENGSSASAYTKLSNLAKVGTSLSSEPTSVTALAQKGGLLLPQAFS